MEINQNTTKNYRVKEEIKNKVKRYFETNENANTTYQNFQGAAKAVGRVNFILLQAYTKKQEIPRKQPDIIV